ncbi:MAG TPA: CPBP family intramembrane glutamic endopeptidase [Tepidisphaeraceae bacterium]|nr:CPBP family intramembrane glutamic endopeptidase [Tepidisphaeraceae bacterium]
MSMFQGLPHAALAEALNLADVLLLVMAAASIAGAVAIGALPPRHVNGPDRIPPGRPAWTLLGVVLGGIGAYLFTVTIYITIKYPPSAQHAAPRAPEDYTVTDNAFLSVAPPLVAFLVLLGGDQIARRTTSQDLGIRPVFMLPGMLAGVFGALLVVPPLSFIEVGLEQAYRAIHYEHETEHPMLHLLRAKPSHAIVAAIVVGACVVAPLAEELLFRGHIQTLIRRMLARSVSRRMSAAPEDFAFPPTPSEGIPLATEFGPPRPKPWQTWVAILITSVLFASLHPLWTAPIIFILSVCLGYAYERTGNLWVPITIHAAFNSLSTAMFLIGLYSS